MNRRRLVLGRVLMVAGVLAVSAAAWRRLLSGDDAALPLPATVGVGLAVVAGVVGVVWWRGRLAAGGQRAVAAQRPGWSLHQVFAGSTLSHELLQQGVWEPRMSVTGGTRMTLAWSPAGVELWRGARTPRLVVSLPWAAVASVREGVAYASSSSRPAVMITTLADAELLVVPARLPDGGMLTASPRATAALVGRLRAARDLAGA